LALPGFSFFFCTLKNPSVMKRYAFTSLAYSSLLWLGCLLLAACTKDPTTGTTTVEGQVVAEASRKPVPGATVQLYHKQNGGYQAVAGATAQADAQGRYALSFEATSPTGYFLTAIAAPGYFTPEQNAPYLTAGRANTGVTIAMLAPAWVRLQLVDEPPKSRVVVHSQGYIGAGDTFYYPRDTVVIRPIEAGFKSAIAWAIDENGQTRTSSLYIQPNALDTIIVRIAF
jgi:hypothetical protein